MASSPKVLTSEIATDVIRSGDRVFIHSVAAAPQALIRGMMTHAPRMRDVEVVHLHTEGPAPYADPEWAGHFRVNALFVGANVRRAVQEGRADYVPVFLSDVPRLFRTGAMPLDVALVQVSPPDARGLCSLGPSCDVTPAAIGAARTVVAQVNAHMPRTFGDAVIPILRFDAVVYEDGPLPEIHAEPASEVETRIGELCAGLIEDGAALQMGIGAIPNAVLAALTNHRDLGVHSEMFSDGLVDLVERGVVTGARKVIMPGKIVTAFAFGTRKTYDFLDDNPQVAMMDIGWVNDTAVIRKNSKTTAINSAIEVDLTGQVCADSIGTLHYSGVGGQMDFIRGAALSEGGKPIIALPSRTRHGESRIVATLIPGAGVVTTRAHMRFLATEYGVAELWGKNLRERAQAIVRLAHPDDREGLARAARERFGPLWRD